MNRRRARRHRDPSLAWRPIAAPCTHDARAALIRPNRSRWSSPFRRVAAADTIGRPLASVAQQHLGQPMVVLNKARRRRGRRRAVRGQRQARRLHRAPRLNTLTEIPQVDELLGGRQPFKKEQFIPIGQVTVTPFAIMVNASRAGRRFRISSTRRGRSRTSSSTRRPASTARPTSCGR